MSYSCGIIGLPNVGKSTLFNAISRSSVPAEDFPFCTIDPNRGRIQVNDPRLRLLDDLLKPASVVPLYLPIVDIAGLVKNASKGEGLGNRFLSHIRETDVLLHTVRCFADADSAASGRQAVDPVTDIEIINTELILADLETVQKCLDKIVRDRKSRKPGQDRLAGAKAQLCEQLLAHLESGRDARTLALEDLDSIAMVDELNLLSAKPVLFICNIDDSEDLHDNIYVQQVRDYVAENYPSEDRPPVCSVCARIEAEISELPAADQAVFVHELGWEEPGLDRIVRHANQLLARLCFFTAGVEEVRAWSVSAGADARTCAGRIHTDFARGFIAAAVVSFDDFIECKGWKGAQEKGRAMMEGAQYQVKDGDIINFRFNI